MSGKEKDAFPPPPSPLLPPSSFSSSSSPSTFGGGGRGRRGGGEDCVPAREAPVPWSLLLPLLENEDGEKESLKSPGCLPSLPPSLCCPVAVPEVPLLTPPLEGREGDGRGREIDARGLSEEGRRRGGGRRRRGEDDGPLWK